MKIAVTGGCGFIGSCLLWKLNSLGIEDILVVDELGKSDKWKNLIGKKYLDYMDKNKFLEYLASRKLDGSLDCIVHLGACTSTVETDASYLMNNNYEYSRKIAEWAVSKQKRFLYASSAATYGSGENGYSDDEGCFDKLKPLNMYGYSKHVFDLWVLRNNLNKSFVGLKFFNVFGPNEYHKGDMRSMVHKGYCQVKDTGKIRLFKSNHPGYKDGEQRRDFVYVKDTVDVIWYFIENGSTAGIYNLGMGKAHSWNELASAIFKALNLKPQVEYFDMPEILTDKYQNFTEAKMDKLRKAGYKKSFMSLNDAVADYIKTLETDKYL